MEPSAARALLTLSESDSSPDSNQASPTVARDVSQGGKALKGESRSQDNTTSYILYLTPGATMILTNIADLFLPFNPIDNSGGDGEYETMIPEPRKRDS